MFNTSQYTPHGISLRLGHARVDWGNKQMEEKPKMSTMQQWRRICRRSGRWFGRSFDHPEDRLALLPFLGGSWGGPVTARRTAWRFCQIQAVAGAVLWPPGLFFPYFSFFFLFFLHGFHLFFHLQSRPCVSHASS